MYYFIEISTTSSGTAKAIWDKNTLDDAIIALHQTMAYSMSNPDALKIVCLILNSEGGILRSDRWERLVEEISD